MIEVLDVRLVAGGAALGLFLMLGTLANDARVGRLRERAKVLELGQQALTRHYQTLSRLDDAQVPSLVLDLAVRFSVAIHDPHLSEALQAAVLRGDAPHPPNRRTPPSEVAQAYADLARARPDLASDFMTSVVSGSIAFTARWPHTTPFFEDIIMPVSSQVDEVKRVVLANDRRRETDLSQWAAAA